MTKTCPNCAKPFESKRNQFCGKSCSTSFNMRKSPRPKTFYDITCLECATPFKSRRSVAKVCSPACQAAFTTRTRKVRGPNLTYAGMPIKEKGVPKPRIRYPIITTCSQCGVNFSAKNKRQTCSSECHYHLLSTTTGHTKKTAYSTKTGEVVTLGSSWEVKVAKFLDANDIDWIRPASLEWFDGSGKSHRYYSDFYLPDLDVYLDPKNPRRLLEDTEKLAYFADRITLLVGNPKHICDSVLGLVEAVGNDPTRLR